MTLAHDVISTKMDKYGDYPKQMHKSRIDMKT
jgi:hypothetical protein